MSQSQPENRVTDAIVQPAIAPAKQPPAKFKQVHMRVTLTSNEADEVMATIYELYQRGFAPVTHWSALQPVPNSPGEVMSVMTRRHGRPIANSRKRT